MRKAQKQEVINCIKSLQQAHEEIKAALNRKSYDQVRNMLSECQDFAVAIGENIEKLEGEGHITVAFLEEYCEALYQIYGELDSEGGASTGRIYKELRKQLMRLENSAKKDIHIHREVVFLPYKASMWDSLESVWKAADEDPDCDAYVIPIPYYDKNPDGSFGKMHYEGDQYPDNVPIIFYDNYDFENRRPDAIFIHNPYDNANYVTSVPPSFYSKKLKEYTDKLVYIPYFILDEIKPDEDERIEGIKHFCLSPGVINSDQVIVQSEDMRQVYIKVLTEAFGEKSRNDWAQKILGLGSPKVDKVLNTRKEDLEIPEEWLRIIRKPDGSWKKIVFYNTSVTALLQHNEQMLKKIQDVLRVFRENRDEVALLWRPHPLIKATINSMRPQLRTEYERIVKKYREEGWGIYDDTADMDRAVCLSDAYYGDGSSVVQLCRQKGMPVIRQNVSILSGEEINLNCADIVKYNEKIYVLTRDTQTLFEYSAESGKMKLCGAVGNKENQLFISMALCKNKIYIAPYGTDELCVYDIQTEDFQHISLKSSGKGLNKNHYQLCFSYHERIYLLGGMDTATVCVDPRTNDLKDISQWQLDFKSKYGYETGVNVHSDVCIVDDCFWVALIADNVLLQYNMKTGEYEFWNVGSKKMRYGTVSFDGEFFWLSGNKAVIVRWEREKNEVREFDNFPSGFQSGYDQLGWKELFCCGHMWHGDIYYAPLNANMLVKLHRESGQIECVVKVDPLQVSFRLVEMNIDEIYMELDSVRDMSLECAYYIGADGSYRLSGFKIGRQDEVDLTFLEKRIKRGYCVAMESHPLWLPKFFNFIIKSGELDTQLNRSYAGEKIIKSLR